MHKKKHIWCSVMIVLIVLFDQITKYLATTFISDGVPVPFIKGIAQFHYALNDGVAFSMFSGSKIITVITIVAVIVGLWFIFSNRCKSLWLYWSIGVVIAGGIGNSIDRIFYGVVVDFIEPTFMNFAIFNIADCAVTLGAISLIAYLVYDLFKKEDINEQKA